MLAEILKLPSWLTSFTTPEVAKTIHRPTKTKSRSLRTFLAPQSSDMARESTREFYFRLADCNTLKDIQKLAIDYRTDMRLSPAYSQLAFRRMLCTRCESTMRSKSSLEPILRFLEDSSLNNPEAQNTRTLFRWCVEQSYDRNNIRYPLKWLKAQISLGFLRGQELLLLVKDLSNPKEATQNKLRQWNVPLVIFEGLNSSTVFQIRDVDTTILNALLESMSYGPFPLKLEFAGFNILQSLDTSQLQQMKHGVSSFLKSYFSAEGFGERGQINYNDKMSKVSNFLQTLPLNIKISILIAISRRFLDPIEPTSTTFSKFIQNFGQWCSFLTKHDIFKLLRDDKDWHQFERDLVGKDTSFVGAYIQNLTNDEKSRFLRRTWLGPIKAPSSINYPLVAADIERWFSRPSIDYSSIQSILTTIFQVSGSKTSTISSKLSYILQVVDKLGMDRTTLALIHSLQERGVHIDHEIIIAQTKKHAFTSPHISFYLFKRTHHLPLESCPAVAEIMIYNARFNPNTALEFRRQRKDFIQVFGSDSGSQNKIEKARIELFQRMAIAYANAPHLFPRVAFRKVYDCYRLHRQYDLGPLSVEISAALTISGIIKPLQKSQWTGTQKLRWILTIVREVEGEAVATRVDELVYTWRGLVHREMEKKRRKLWRLKTLGINDIEAENVKRESQRKNFRNPFSTNWMLWGKTKDENTIRRVLWAPDMINPLANEPDPPEVGSPSMTDTISAPSKGGPDELDGVLASDVLVWRGIERFRKGFRG